MAARVKGRAPTVLPVTMGHAAARAKARAACVRWNHTSPTHAASSTALSLAASSVAAGQSAHLAVASASPAALATARASVRTATARAK